ncbi:hypothetical protein VTK73DRAFT_8002 [Phialemonium thermophilum]|uniref:Xylanolytic transcriptional activator regulatory domain-containing protein n=1 Tax=Phialemonium thermophilum TaxID=223376 RepID=A0ABR3XRB9_9PEZI
MGRETRERRTSVPSCESPISLDGERFGSLQSDPAGTGSHHQTADRNGWTGLADESWLYSEELPNTAQLRHVVDSYFAHIHPLRALGFIHKPSFMRALDRNTLVAEFGLGLVYVVCALGASCLPPSRAASRPCPSPRSSQAGPIPGKAWGARARAIVQAECCSPAIQTLMAMVLYCEYGIRIGDHAFVFMLTGCCTRMSRLFRIDSENDSLATRTAPTPTEATRRESIRRLLWSCYILDSIIGSGVEGNLSWIHRGPDIPLPCPESDFSGQTASDPVGLGMEGSPHELSVAGIDIRGHVARIVFLRTQVLHCIRTSNPADGPEPWDESSRYMQLLSWIATWYRGLPQNLTLQELNIYIHREQETLGAFFFLHIAYHSCLFDLCRICLAGYSFPLAAAMRQAPPEFLAEQQQQCFHHAESASRILQTALDAGCSGLDDSFAPTCAFESTKIQVVYFTTLGHGERALYERVRANININLRVLVHTHPYADTPNVYLAAICPFLVHFGFSDIASQWEPYQNTVLLPGANRLAQAPNSDQQGAEVVGPVEASYLNQISTFRLARSQLGQHAPTSVSGPQQYPSDSGRKSPSLDGRSSWSLAGADPAERGTVDGAASGDVINAAQPTRISIPYSMLNQPETQPLPLPEMGNLVPTFSTPQNEDYYLRMAQEISHYMTWDGSLGLDVGEGLYTDSAFAL